MIALLRRDLLLAFRSGGGFGLSLAFFLMLCTLVPFSVGPESGLLSLIAPGILWLGAMLSCLLSLDRIFQLDFEDGSLELLAVSTIPLEACVLIKGVAHWLVTGLALTLISPVLAILLNMPPSGHIWIFVTLLVGTPALSMIGCFGAALTIGVKRGGLILTIIVLPFYIPTLIFGAEAALQGAMGQENSTSLAILAAISTASVAFFPYITAVVLRANFR